VDDVVLRAATAADATAVADVYLASRRTFLPFAPLAHDEADVRAWIRDVLVPGGVVLAVAGVEIVGLLGTAHDADGVGWIDQLYLAPGFTGSGIGRRLLEHALAELPRPVRLHTFQANAGARRFYARHGFVPIAFGDGSDNEERVPDVLYELAGGASASGPGAESAAPEPDRRPVFASARLQLRPARAGDLDVLHRLWNDPQVRRYLFDDRPVSRQLAGEVLAGQLARAPEGLGLWMVETRSRSRVLGCVGLYPVTAAARHEPALAGLLEPLAALMPAHWGAGYANEALSFLLDYAFDELAVSTVAGVTDVPNVASQRMLRTLGFELLSETPGERYRQLNYLLHRSMWPARPRGQSHPV
jgi:RimJ/RimL family protein N-acetyltransferase